MQVENTAMKFSPVFGSMGTTIFSVMSALAAEHGAINLGQGFPDEDGPLSIREAAAQALLAGPNQYPPTRGLPELRHAIAKHANRFYDLDFDPEREVLITSGGTEALTASMLALLGPGDEAVLIEPAYDSYRPIAEAAGAIVRTVKLEPPLWRLREEDLAAQINSKTRVVRVGSAGKMFSLTGWKVGWVTGDAPLIDVIAKAHQFLTFTTPPALQRGTAYALAHEMDFTLDLTKAFQENRDLLARGLTHFGFEVLNCEGTYFLTAGIQALNRESDQEFCRRLVREAGVATIPIGAFFEGGKPDYLVRFAFCKKRAIIEEALSRLQHYFARRVSTAT